MYFWYIFLEPSRYSPSVCKITDGLDDGWLRLKRNCIGETYSSLRRRSLAEIFSFCFFLFNFFIFILQQTHCCVFSPPNHKKIPTPGVYFIHIFFNDSTRKGLGRRKMGCLGNSKTEDQRIDEKAQREANKKIEKQLQKERQAYKATHRLLLLGKVDLNVTAGLKCKLTVIPFV